MADHFGSIVVPVMIQRTPPCCRRNLESQVFNLGPRGKRLRMLGGIALFLATSTIAVFLARYEAHVLWRVALFLPFFFAIMLVLQARTRTCVVLAALGAWDLDCGMQRVPDRNLERRLRRRAYALVFVTFLVAVLLTGIVALV